MNVYDSSILSKANTQYSNIVETLEGHLVIGSEENYFNEGKVLIAAANPDMMEYYISKNDLVILGNRYESQLCAIEMEAACIIVCEGAAVSITIKKLAQERGCTVITTPYDTDTAARLINQSCLLYTAEYNSMELCPPDKMKRSRFGHCGSAGLWFICLVQSS